MPEELRGGDLNAQLDRALARCNELYRMVQFLRNHASERILEHPEWIVGMERLLDGQHFDALELP